MRKSVQTELDEFFGHLQQQAQLVHQVSAQAFAQRRGLSGTSVAKSKPSTRRSDCGSVALAAAASRCACSIEMPKAAHRSQITGYGHISSITDWHRPSPKKNLT